MEDASMAQATDTSSSAASAPVPQQTIPGLTPDELSEAIFGTFDGMTSLPGVIAGALVSGTEHILVVTAAGLAVAATRGHHGTRHVHWIVPAGDPVYRAPSHACHNRIRGSHSADGRRHRPRTGSETGCAC